MRRNTYIFLLLACLVAFACVLRVLARRFVSAPGRVEGVELVVKPNLPAYGGCTSWITLDESLLTAGAAPALDDEAFSRAARTIALSHLDRLWAEHLAMLSEVREGVHLRALGRLDPLDEFHRAAVPAFNELIPEIEVRTVATFEELDFTKDWQPEDVGIVRPSATWTYLVYDNPFGSELDRLVAKTGRAAPVSQDVIAKLHERLKADPASWSEHRLAIRTAPAVEQPPSPKGERVGLFVGVGKFQVGEAGNRFRLVCPWEELHALKRYSLC